MSQHDKKDTPNPPIKDPSSNPSNPSAKPGMKEDDHKTGSDKPAVKTDEQKSNDGKSGTSMSGDSKR
jgi:hypothetical protein